mgnify:CR=1 FL=1
MESKEPRRFSFPVVIGILNLVFVGALVVLFVVESGPQPPLSDEELVNIQAGVPQPAPHEPRFEDNLAGQLASLPPPTSMQTQKEFPALLAEGIGLDAFDPPASKGASLQVAEEKDVAGGKLTDFRIRFGRPPIATRALLLAHSPKSAEMVVVLHGHNTTAEDTLGLTESEDYMHAVGRKLFDEGYDVLVPELSCDGVVSGFINASLALWGAQIYGLWVRTVCDLSHGLKLKEQYQRVSLYGMSNGGLVADKVSALCGGFDIVFVDDILTDWRAYAAQNMGLMFQHQQYAVYYLNRFLSQSSFLGYLDHSTGEKFYTRTQEYFEANLAPGLDGAYVTAPLSDDASIHLLYKEHPEHEPETALLLNVLKGEWKKASGVSLKKL